MSKKILLLFILFGFFQSLTWGQSSYLLFEENFTDNRNNWLTGDRPKTLALIQEDVFYFASKRPKYNYSRRKEIGFFRANQDFEIEIKIRQVSGDASRGYALEWGGNSLDNSFYEFWVRNDGYFSIDKFNGQTRQFKDYVAWKRSAAILINAYNLLTVRKIGNEVFYYINQTEVWRGKFEGIQGSEVGFITPPAQAAIEVDYLRLNLLNNAPESIFNKKNIPAIWVVIVGINDYQHNESGLKDLSFTVNDAKAMYDFYTSPNGGGVPKENIYLLTNEKATKKAILQTTTQVFEKAQAQDLVVFYFAGHGIAPANADNQFFFVPCDYTTNNLQTALHCESIQTIFESCKADKKLWVIDACHSGGSIETIRGENITDKLGNIKNTEIALLTSANVGETSLEVGDDIQRGLFSYYLTQGLVHESSEADANEDSFISVYELFSYAQKKTRQKALVFNHYQTPQIAGKFNVQTPLSKVQPKHIEIELDKD